MLNFPSNPQDRQIYPYPPISGVNTFVYNQEKGAWNRIATVSTQEPIEVITENISSINVRQIIDLGSGSVVDCSLGNYFIKNTAANTDFVFANAPEEVAYEFTLRITHGNSIITWPANVSWSENEGAPVLIPFRDNLFFFLTEDGGTNWKGYYSINYP